MHDFQAVTRALQITNEQLSLAIERVTSGAVTRQSFHSISELALISADLSSQLAALASEFGPLNVHTAPKGVQ